MPRTPTATWLDQKLADLKVTPALRKDILFKLRYAGFGQTVTDETTSLASKVVDAVIENANNMRQAAVRVATVVEAGSPCPGCGGKMVSAELSPGQPVQYCPACRVSGWIK